MARYNKYTDELGKDEKEYKDEEERVENESIVSITLNDIAAAYNNTDYVSDNDRESVMRTLDDDEVMLAAITMEVKIKKFLVEKHKERISRWRNGE